MSTQEELRLQRELDRLREEVSQLQARVQSLQESEQRYRALVDATLVGVYVIQDGKIVQANATAAHIFGYTVEEILGQELRVIVTPESWPTVEENLGKRLRGEVDSIRYPVRGLMKSGKRLDIEVHGSRTTFRGQPAIVGTVVDRTEERRAEMALRVSEARFQAFMNNTPSIAFMRDPAGYFVYANRAFFELTGTAADCVLGKHTLDIFGPDMRESVLVSDSEMLETRRAIENSADYTGPDGIARHFLVFKFPVEDLDGGLLVGCIAVDISERGHAEAALAEQKRILESILDSMGDGVAVTNEDGKFLIFNPAARRITGLGPVGHTPEEWTDDYGIFLPDGTRHPPDQIPLARAMRGESTDNVELMITNPGKKAGAWITCTGRPLVDDQGELRGGVVVFRDITARRETLDQLRRAEAKYRALVEQLPVVSYIAEPGPYGATQYVSPQIESLLGFPPEAWIGSNLWMEQLHPEDRDRVVTEIQRCLGAQERCVLEYRLFAKDGSIIWVHDEAVFIPAAQGDRAAIQGVILDITDREVERGQRKRLHALSRDLVAIQEAEARRIGRELHDEIGQILTALKLRLGTNNGVAPADLERRLHEADQLLDEAVEQVRALSQDLRPSVLDDLGLLPALLSYFGRYTRQTGIRVSFENRGVERRRFSVEVETAAYRIVQEALTNAARHARVGEVHVRAWADESRLGVQIEDFGPGFDADLVLADGRTRGLMGMRERALLLQGQLTIEAMPGRGCRVTGELPIGEEVSE